MIYVCFRDFPHGSSTMLYEPVRVHLASSISRGTPTISSIPTNRNVRGVTTGEGENDVFRRIWSAIQKQKYRAYTKEWCGFNSIHYWNRTILLCIPCIMKPNSYFWPMTQSVNGWGTLPNCSLPGRRYMDNRRLCFSASTRASPSQNP
jgi:hypothetical protein